MRVYVGTSGYQYKGFRGTFYSERCREADMLVEYGQQLPSVELNNTFYRSPRRAQAERWAQQVPALFRFAIKAPRRITHQQRLQGSEQHLAWLYEALAGLGERLGVVLYQLPPQMRVDVPRLQAFLAALPKGVPAAFEFRHPSWAEEGVFAALREYNAALCVTDNETGTPLLPHMGTADFAYLRLRREMYDDSDLAALARRIHGLDVDRVFAFFKHEESGPGLALRLRVHCEP